MIFEQFFDPGAHALSYLLAGGPGEDAVLIDPVDRDIARYRDALAKLCSPLKLVIDTHLHADHVTGAGELARATGCLVAMSEKTEARHVTMRLFDGQRLKAGTLQVHVTHTRPYARCDLHRDGGPGLHRRHIAYRRNRADRSSWR